MAATERELKLRLEIVNAEIQLENAKRDRVLAEVELERVALAKQQLICRTQSQNDGKVSESLSTSVSEDEEEEESSGIPDDAADNEIKEEMAGIPYIQVEIFVKTFLGEDFPINADISWTTETLKAEIQKMRGVPPDQYRLIFSGRQMEDGRSLADYRIRQGSIIHQVLRLRGC